MLSFSTDTQQLSYLLYTSYNLVDINSLLDSLLVQCCWCTKSIILMCHVKCISPQDVSVCELWSRTDEFFLWTSQSDKRNWQCKTFCCIPQKWFLTETQRPKLYKHSLYNLYYFSLGFFSYCKVDIWLWCFPTLTKCNYWSWNIDLYRKKQKMHLQLLFSHFKDTSGLLNVSASFLPPSELGCPHRLRSAEGGWRSAVMVSVSGLFFRSPRAYRARKHTENRF